MQAKLYEFLQSKKAIKVLAVDDFRQAVLAREVASFFGYKCHILPDFRAEKGDDMRSFLSEIFDLCLNLSSFYESQKKGEKTLLISPIFTLLRPLPSEKQLTKKRIEFADKIDLCELKDYLLKAGYVPTSLVQSPGEFCIKGDKIDVFSLAHKNPCRIILFDDECESLRFFDSGSQLSEKKELEFFEILPILCLRESINECSQCEDYWQLKMDDFCEIYKIFGIQDYSDLDARLSATISPAAKFHDAKIIFSDEFFSLNKNKKIRLLASNESKFLGFKLGENVEKITSDLVINIASENEFLLSLNHFKHEANYKAKITLNELKKNDFLVHEKYGIGKFRGLCLVKNELGSQEFLQIEYANSEKLLLPTTSLHLVDRYVASAIPSLDRLGKNTFVKLKEKAQKKLFAIASNILELAAKRSLIHTKSIKIPIDYDNFDAAAGFSLTPHQQDAVAAIFSDLSQTIPMDRLLSADVGFGKTEVAMRALFACVRNEQNALFFVPTTLLCMQHYKTLKERFSPFGIEVFMLNRFAKSKKEILSHKGAKIIIGTHALLSLQIDNIGLIVIDEEHKFGVKHKEKIKELAIKAHQLSMSATPIPRTLSLALSTLKSYSQILTPPPFRQDVRTFIKEFDDALLKEIIARELRRGGQIFYIHNHILSIENKKNELLRLYPSLRILVLHSKINQTEAEEKMLEFKDKKYDLLLSTSIVESGIDIANANTIIIANAERFGIADLHQLRGRVGRGKEQGFCYFLCDFDELGENAKSRLLSLASNSYLGSGAALAQMDLELRGGGNLLGAEQSGHIEQLGYSLYVKMLEDELNRLSKRGLQNAEFEQKLSLNAYINADIVRDDSERLSLYRRFSECKNLSELAALEDEFCDRFCPPDAVSKNYFSLIAIKILCEQQGFLRLSNFGANISFYKKCGEKEERITLKAAHNTDESILQTCLEFLNKNRSS